MFDARLLSGVGVMIAVVEAGSFVRAADALGLTPSGVSRAIARLETRIGIRLFDRNPRAVVLTEEGRRFHEEVAQRRQKKRPVRGLRFAAVSSSTSIPGSPASFWRLACPS